MPSVAHSETFLRLTLVTPCDHVQLAAPTLARHLAIPVTEAARLEAQHGMRVEIETMTTQDPVVFTDLSPL
ncbi:MAG: hypothetical protein HC809_12585 [Gammaproteobacteria bacterium]|nr:hypothetical protein [Gammaproteobacteria bacterium]